MLGRVLSGPALFLMERGGGRWLLRLERSWIDTWRFFSGKRKSAFPEKMERRGDRFRGEALN